MADEDWDTYPDPNCCCERRHREKKSICTMCWFGEHINCYDKETPVSEHNHEDLTNFVDGCPKCAEQRQGGAERVSLAQDAEGNFESQAVDADQAAYENQQAADSDQALDETADAAKESTPEPEQSPGTATNG